MNARIESTLTLEEVAEHFARWRRSKRKGDRIPEKLWREAAALVSSYGVSRVARRLRLSGTDLNKRRRMTEAVRNEEASDGATPFVEIEPVVVDQAVRPESVALWLELERADGMRLRLGGAQGADLLGLVARFMETRSCCS